MYLGFTPPTPAVITSLELFPDDVKIAQAIGGDRIKYQVVCYLKRRGIGNPTKLHLICREITGWSRLDLVASGAVLDLLTNGVIKSYGSEGYGITVEADQHLERFALCYDGRQTWEWGLQKLRRAG